MLSVQCHEVLIVQAEQPAAGGNFWILSHRKARKLVFVSAFGQSKLSKNQLNQWNSTANFQNFRLRRYSLTLTQKSLYSLNLQGDPPTPGGVSSVRFSGLNELDTLCQSTTGDHLFPAA